MLFEIQAAASMYQTKMAQYSLYSVEEKCVSLPPLCNRLTQFKCIPGEFVVRFIRYVCSKLHKSNNHFYNRCSLHTVVVEICIGCLKSVFENTRFPKSKEHDISYVNSTGNLSTWPKEHDISSVNSTANLSTLRHLTNQSIVMEWHTVKGMTVSRLATLSPSLSPFFASSPQRRLLFWFGFCLCLQAKAMKKINSFRAYNFSAKYKISWSSQGKSQSSEAIAFS